ncbi:MAG: hypothetical protein E2O68_05505 [Deltaproteobacteria bacterium]|nr:MAG: hypothetical protein E2O68_05505 [Deltaproteobacteria bacterium]
MKAMLNLAKDINKMPIFWVIWVWCLFSANMAAVFFLGHLEGKVVLGCIMVAATLMPYLHSKFGYVRLLGAAHFVWLPMLIWLYTRLDSIKLVEGLYKWILLIFFLDGISLIIDIIDVVKYSLGQRKPTV